MTRGSVTVAHRADPDRSAVRAKMVASGSSTIRLRYVHVIPRDRPKPGRTLRDPCLMFSAPRLIDLIEQRTVSEVRGVGLLPSSEHFVNGHEVYLGKLSRILGCHRRHPRPVEMTRGNLLPRL